MIVYGVARLSMVSNRVIFVFPGMIDWVNLGYALTNMEI